MRHRFVILDAFRGIAAAAVATSHAPLFFHSIATHGSVPDASGRFPLTGPLFEAYLAVDFFFLLSGFVLAHAYGDKLKDGMSPWRFMGLRFVRLYPLYLLALAIALWPYAHIGAAIPAGTTLVQTLTALFFLPSPISDRDGYLFPINAPAWSLFFELIVNCVFAVLAPMLTFARLIALVSIAGAALICAVTFHRFTFGTLGFGAMAAGFDWSGLGAGFLRAFCGFFCGVLCHGLVQRFPWRAGVTPLLPCAVLVAALSLHPPVGLQTVYDLTAVLAVFPLLVMTGASMPKPRYALGAARFLGAASYGVYVLQIPIYMALLYILRNVLGFHLDNLSFWSGIGFVASLFLIAYAAYRFYDAPVRRWLTATFTGGAWRSISSFPRW